MTRLAQGFALLWMLVPAERAIAAVQLSCVVAKNLGAAKQAQQDAVAMNYAAQWDVNNRQDAVNQLQQELTAAVAANNAPLLASLQALMSEAQADLADAESVQQSTAADLADAQQRLDETRQTDVSEFAVGDQATLLLNFSITGMPADLAGKGVVTGSGKLKLGPIKLPWKLSGLNFTFPILGDTHVAKEAAVTLPNQAAGGAASVRIKFDGGKGIGKAGCSKAITVTQ
ncbi:MAG: hypothetical protein FIA97_09085 [Methylococcaceae bacterium]|nr:hypothetical protein [Methylococcaceae bacterium]